MYFTFYKQVNIFVSTQYSVTFLHILNGISIHKLSLCHTQRNKLTTDTKLNLFFSLQAHLQVQVSVLKSELQVTQVRYRYSYGLQIRTNLVSMNSIPSLSQTPPILPLFALTIVHAPIQNLVKANHNYYYYQNLKSGFEMVLLNLTSTECG